MRNGIYLFIAALALCSNSCIAQVKSNPNETKHESHLEFENEDILSSKEMELLNSILGDSNENFDFHGKKLAFITGNSGNMVLSKVEFFKSCISPWVKRDEKPQVSLIILNENEKANSGGYDALVLAWTKLFTDKQKGKVIKQLNNN